MASRSSLTQLAGWQENTDFASDVTHYLPLGYAEGSGVKKCLTRIASPNGFAFGFQISSSGLTYSETVTETYIDDPEPQAILDRINQAIADLWAGYKRKRYAAFDLEPSVNSSAVVSG